MISCGKGSLTLLEKDMKWRADTKTLTLPLRKGDKYAEILIKKRKTVGGDRFKPRKPNVLALNPYALF